MVDTPPVTPTPVPSPTSQTPPAPTPPAKPKVKLPLPFVVATVGTVIFVLGALLDFYDLQSTVPSPSLMDTLAGKVGICLALVGLLLVTIKKFGLLACVAFATVFGAVFAPFLNVINGDDGVVNLVNGVLVPAGGEQAGAGMGLYATLVGSAIALVGAMVGAGLIKKAKASTKK
jgi:hypothetical protein